MNARDLIPPMLEVAVPLWIARLQKMPWSTVLERSHVCVQIIAEKGDVLQFGSKRKGAAGDAFNALAEGVACLAFARGGVKIFGLHFEAKHPEPEK